MTADQRAKMRERRPRRERSPRPGAMSVSSDDPSAYREKRKNNRRMASGDRSMRSKEEHSTPQERADRRIKARAREGRRTRPGAVPGRHNDASAARETKRKVTENDEGRSQNPQMEFLVTLVRQMALLVLLINLLSVFRNKNLRKKQLKHKL